MLLDNSIKSEDNYQSKYTCIICLERVQLPVSCARCKKLICQQHIRKIDNRCPYCRLTPFQYEEDRFLDELVKLDKKKEEEFLIANKVFKCLVEGCNFEGKYHKMDLHRRRQHRNQSLRQIIFPQDRQKGKKIKAMELLVRRLQEKQQKNKRAYQVSLVLHNRSGKRVPLKTLYEMVLHTEFCQHKQCKRAHVEQSMCFIGDEQKELSDCPLAQQFLIFY